MVSITYILQNGEKPKQAKAVELNRKEISSHTKRVTNMKGFLNNWDFKELIFQQDEKIGKDL